MIFACSIHHCGICWGGRGCGEVEELIGIVWFDDLLYPFWLCLTPLPQFGLGVLECIFTCFIVSSLRVHLRYFTCDTILLVTSGYCPRPAPSEVLPFFHGWCSSWDMWRCLFLCLDVLFFFRLVEEDFHKALECIYSDVLVAHYWLVFISFLMLR